MWRIKAITASQQAASSPGLVSSVGAMMNLLILCVCKTSNAILLLHVRIYARADGHLKAFARCDLSVFII
jgi:hypothetical protein